MKEKISWLFFMNRKKRNFKKYFKHYDIKNYLDLKSHIDSDLFIIPTEDKVKEYFVKEELKANDLIDSKIENKANPVKLEDSAVKDLSSIRSQPKKRKPRKKQQAPKDEDKRT